MLSGRGLGCSVAGLGEALPSSSSTSEDTVFALKAQRATVGAPGSRAGLRMARLSASTVECAVDGLGRWAVSAKRPRLETFDNSSVKQLADLGGELSCTVDWASDDGLIVKARAPARPRDGSFDTVRPRFNKDRRLADFVWRRRPHHAVGQES